MFRTSTFRIALDAAQSLRWAWWLFAGVGIGISAGCQSGATPFGGPATIPPPGTAKTVSQSAVPASAVPNTTVPWGNPNGPNAIGFPQSSTGGYPPAGGYPPPGGSMSIFGDQNGAPQLAANPYAGQGGIFDQPQPAQPGLWNQMTSGWGATPGPQGGALDPRYGGTRRYESANSGFSDAMPPVADTRSVAANGTGNGSGGFWNWMTGASPTVPAPGNAPAWNGQPAQASGAVAAWDPRNPNYQPPAIPGQNPLANPNAYPPANMNAVAGNNWNIRPPAATNVAGSPLANANGYTNYGVSQPINPLAASRTLPPTGNPIRNAATGTAAPNMLPAGWPGAQANPNAIPNASEAPVSVRNLGDLPRVDGR